MDQELTGILRTLSSSFRPIYPKCKRNNKITLQTDGTAGQ